MFEEMVIGYMRETYYTEVADCCELVDDEDEMETMHDVTTDHESDKETSYTANNNTSNNNNNNNNNNNRYIDCAVHIINSI